MTRKELLQRALHLLSVPRCVCCGHPLDFQAQALCPRCQADYEIAKDRICSVCFSPIHRCTCAPDRLKKHFVHSLIKVTRYVPDVENIPANHLIYALKQQHRQDVIDYMAAELSIALTDACISLQNTLLVEVPRRRKAIIEYGYDHVRLLAHTLSRQLGAEHRSVLVSHAKHPQKGLRRFERATNVRMGIRRRYSNIDLKGKNILLIDDVVTTGYSMSHAATLLHGLGAGKITGICFSIAYPDPPIMSKH